MLSSTTTLCILPHILLPPNELNIQATVIGSYRKHFILLSDLVFIAVYITVRILANSLPLPPFTPPTLWTLAHSMLLVEVENGAKPTEEPGVHPLPLPLPLKERVVHVKVSVQHVQVLCKLGRVFELVHMEEGVGWSHRCIILKIWPHNDGQDVVPKPVDEELLGDVVLAVGVLKGQVELVVIL